MSNYKIKISKRIIVDQEDSSAWIQEPESFADDDAMTKSQQDIDVSVYMDDVIKHTVTLTDAGATLEFDTDVLDGSHSIKVVPAKTPVHQTDVCVDKVLIDDKVVVMTQWDFNNKIFGTTSTLRQLLSAPQSTPHPYVWWGIMLTNDSSYDLPGNFYRPKIVSDHQGEWHWAFVKNNDGKLWISQPGDTKDILYDSTQQHTYYACEPQVITQENATGWGESEQDSSSASWTGPGTYDATLNYVDASVDESQESADRLVIYSQVEYLEYKFNSWYHNQHTVTPITVT